MKNYCEDKRAGWDDLYEDCFEDINKIIEDNLNLTHNDLLINSVFSKMSKALEEANIRMKEIPGDENKKEFWFKKLESIKNYLEEANTINKKVIGINMVDQFLRSTY